MCALREQFLGELIQCNNLFNELTEALLQAAGLDLVSEALRAVELFAQMKNTLTGALALSPGRLPSTHSLSLIGGASQPMD